MQFEIATERTVYFIFQWKFKQPLFLIKKNELRNDELTEKHRRLYSKWNAARTENKTPVTALYIAEKQIEKLRL